MKTTLLIVIIEMNGIQKSLENGIQKAFLYSYENNDVRDFESQKLPLVLRASHVNIELDFN